MQTAEGTRRPTYVRTTGPTGLPPDPLGEALEAHRGAVARFGERVDAFGVAVCERASWCQLGGLGALLALLLGLGCTTAVPPAGCGAVPTATAGEGAGQGGMAFVDGGDCAGTLHIAVGQLPLGLRAVIAEVRFSAPMTDPPVLLLVPADLPTQQLHPENGITIWYFDQDEVTAASWKLRAADAVNATLSANQDYAWNFTAVLP